MAYNTDLGYGIRVKYHDAEPDFWRPAGHVVEIHFYEKADAVKYAADLIFQEMSKQEKL